jgi:hypothetical protein
MLYGQADEESIHRICWQDLVSLILTNKGVLTYRWEVDSPNMPVRSSRTSSRRQGRIGRPTGIQFTNFFEKI